ncbi:MAG: methyltransferase domain-containing protein, partial [Planctomycetota bacterium]|nr:methyltransferase domain-containing protein [Planctomycetota bacterium]
SVDIVVSNCVLNLVHPDDRRSLFDELGRVLKTGGRAVISDIVASADVPKHLQQDLSLWSGCVSGAFREDRFCEAFSAAGLVQVEMLHRQDEPWTVVEGIEFRSVTVRAFRPADSSDTVSAGPAGLTILSGEQTSCCQPGEECC